MSGLFVNEFVGASVQVLIFSLIPLIFWLISARKKQNFFQWIGFQKVRHEGKWPVTACAIVIATGTYIGLTILALATHNIPVVIVMTILPGAFEWFQGWMNEKRFGGSIIPSWLLHGTINVIVATLSL